MESFNFPFAVNQSKKTYSLLAELITELATADSWFIAPHNHVFVVLALAKVLVTNLKALASAQDVSFGVAKSKNPKNLTFDFLSAL